MPISLLTLECSSYMFTKKNCGNPASALVPLASLNVRLETLAEHIMAPYLLSPETRNSILAGFLDSTVLPSVSIHRFPVHFNLKKSPNYDYSDTGMIGT